MGRFQLGIAMVLCGLVLENRSIAETERPDTLLLKRVCHMVVSRGGTTYFPDERCQEHARDVQMLSTAQVFLEARCRRVVGDECKEFKDHGVYPYLILETSMTVHRQ